MGDAGLRLWWAAARFLVVGGLVLVVGACSDDDPGPVAPAATSTSTSTSVGTATTATTTVGSATTGPMTGATATTVSTVSTSPTTGSGDGAGEVTIRGTVSVIFASARVLQIDPPVDGYSEVALTESTEYRRADGSLGSLVDVNEGSSIEVTGETGVTGSLIARLVKVVG